MKRSWGERVLGAGSWGFGESENKGNSEVEWVWVPGKGRGCLTHAIPQVLWWFRWLVGQEGLTHGIPWVQGGVHGNKGGPNPRGPVGFPNSRS